MKITDEDNMKAKKHSEYIKQCAINGWGLKSHGFIYLVENGFSAKLTDTVYIKDGVVMKENFNQADYTAKKEKYIKEGSLVEFRYECNAHCRDIDNDYWEIDVAVLALKCTPFAKIDYSVRMENKMELKEILETRSYGRLR